ncbi:MAG: hypothetical protein QM765_35930 [Myxococcales bacterium]
MSDHRRALLFTLVLLIVLGALALLRSRRGWAPSETERLELRCSREGWDACLELGLHYLRGTGVPRDLHRARELLHLACEHERWRACAFEGAILRDGGDGPADLPGAAVRFEKACTGQDFYGCYLLALAELHGPGRGEGRAQGPRQVPPSL